MRYRWAGMHFNFLGRLRQKLITEEPEPQHARVFTLPQGVRVYAVGDIHGRANLLAKMLAKIREDARAHGDKKIIEVFLGDYVDRGLSSRKVIDLLLEPPHYGAERICLLGNHEEILLKFLENPAILRDWSNFGGFATLTSYDVPIPASMSPEKLSILRDAFARNLPVSHLEFFKKLGTHYTVGDYLFVHAGIVPQLALQDQTTKDMLWIRGAFLNYEGSFDHYVVHGHSPVAGPDIRANRANLDISAAPQNSLCCLAIEGTERTPIIVFHDDD